MNFVNVLSWLPLRIVRYGRTLLLLGRREIEIVVNALVTYLLMLLTATFAGLLLSKFGYYLITTGADPNGFAGMLMGLGSSLVVLAGVVSGILLLYIYTRVGVLAHVASKVSHVLSDTIRQVTRPFPDLPLEFPVLLQTETVAENLRRLASAFAALFGACAYTVLVPVYENLTAYFFVLILAYFITFAILAGWVEEGKLKVKEKFVYLAFWLAVAITLSYFVPAGIKKPLTDYWGFEVQTFGRHVFRKQFREKAGEQAKESAKYFEGQIIEKLRRQREDLMMKVVNGAPLTEDLKWEIARVNQQIEEVESGVLTKTPSLSQRVSFSPVWSPQMPYLTWKEIVFGLLGIALLVWVVFIQDEKKAKTTSSGGGHAR